MRQSHKRESAIKILIKRKSARARDKVHQDACYVFYIALSVNLVSFDFRY